MQLTTFRMLRRPEDDKSPAIRFAVYDSEVRSEDQISRFMLYEDEV